MRINDRPAIAAYAGGKPDERQKEAAPAHLAGRSHRYPAADGPCHFGADTPELERPAGTFDGRHVAAAAPDPARLHPGLPAAGRGGHAAVARLPRSEEPRVGTDCVSPCTSRW